MSNLITAAEFAANRKISQKYNQQKADEAITLAQESDLQNFLGDFYFDLLQDFQEVSFTDLMNGATFQYEDETFIHLGIKKMLSDLTFARYIYSINVNLTSFGAGSKDTQDSTPIDRNTTKDLSKQAQQDADIKFRTIKKYLLSNPNNIFDRYCDSQNNNTGSFAQRISRL